MTNFEATLLGIIGFVLSSFTGMIIHFIRVKSKETVQKIANSTSKQTIFMVEDLINDVINSLELTILREIKEKSADGKLTTDEINSIVITVKKEVNTILKKHATEELAKKFIGDWEKWLEMKIRSAIGQFVVNRPHLSRVSYLVD